VAGDSALATALVGVHVLLVDPDDDARDLLIAVLAYCGASVTSAASEIEALALANTKTPDVVVAEVAMPEGDGYGLARRVTALTEPRASGFDAHFPKPVDPWALCRMVASLAREP
jgi:PleD family two-component response regulator